MSPKDRLHQDKNAVQILASFLNQPQMRYALDWALLEMQHQCALSDQCAESLQFKQAGAVQFTEILLNLGNKTILPKSKPLTQLDHNA